MTADQATATTVTAPTGVGSGEPSRLVGPQIITNEFIDSISRGHCGWSKKQLQLLGVGWPPPSGWRQRLVGEGRNLSAEEVGSLYEARKPKRPAEADPPEITELPCPWCSRPVKRIKQGGHTREFCSRAHKNSYNAALTKASIEYSRLLRAPGALQIWASTRVNPSPRGGDGLPRTTEAAEQQGGSTAAPDDDLPF